MPPLAIAALPFLQFLATISSVISYEIALPNCTNTCNNITIPYPFGIGDERCYREGFKLVCDPAYNPPKLFMNDPGYEVLKIKLKARVLYLNTRIHQFLGSNSYNENWPYPFPLLDDRNYRVSSAKNAFIALGCGFQFSISLPGAEGNTSTCNSTCRPGYPTMAVDGTCSGIGCCDTTVAGDSNSYTIKLVALDETNSALPQHRVPFNASIIVVKAEWWRRTDNAMSLEKEVLSSLSPPAGGPNSAPKVGIRTVVNWMPGNSSCAEAQKSADFGCLSNYSDCLDDPPRGYACQCHPGFEGNPYMLNGCQDIDECTQPGPPPCFGQCINTLGSYYCICPAGTTGDPQVKNGCVQNKLKISGLIIAIGLGSSTAILLLFFSCVIMRRKLRARKAKRLKEFYFRQNRGLLLQQLVDKDIAEKMIFSLEELENATNSFDEARRLGGGGHGTVYKGILSDQRIVAIKKSRYTIKREIDDFINEVAILSQVNHRNVVKLFGCCLETEVPLLVYEFIANGTLHEHLHMCAPQSLSWKERMRIALEIARSLAYLHSSASVSIIHRDIKTANILLDDRLIAKVSDFGASRGMPIDQTGVTTTIQGTIGYLDPEYFQTSRLTEKSDVYSFGVILVELLTRRKPSAYISPEGFNLVAQFSLLVSVDRLYEILDPQVIEEVKGEIARKVAEVAAMCLNSKSEGRPTMRQVEVLLEGLQSSANRAGSYQMTEENAVRMNHPPVEESNTNVVDYNLSRRFSMEEEFLSSMSFPR